MFLKNRNIISKIKRSKVTDYAALMIIYTMKVTFLKCQILMFFSVLECKKSKSRSHGKSKNGNIKLTICTEKRLNTSLKDLSMA